MINQKLNDAINAQINAELYSAYLYLSMSTYFSDNDLPGFANWMRIQFEEEQFHAFKFYDYLLERGGKVKLECIEKPESDFEGIIPIFEQTLKHEEHVTSLISDLMTLAIEEKDYATSSFLQWFIDEQVEEEAAANEILSQLKLIGGTGHGLLVMDKEFKTRVFVAPAK